MSIAEIIKGADTKMHKSVEALRAEHLAERADRELHAQVAVEARRWSRGKHGLDGAALRSSSASRPFPAVETS